MSRTLLESKGGKNVPKSYNIKPLEWSKITEDRYEASTVIGVFAVLKFTGRWWWELRRDDFVDEYECDSLEQGTMEVWERYIEELLPALCDAE